MTIDHPRTRFSIRSTCAIGVVGRMPWPRLKISGPPAELGEHVVHLAVERLAAGEQDQRIDIALHRHARLDFSRAKSRSISLSRLTASTPVSVDIARDILAGAARKTDDFGARLLARAISPPAAWSAAPTSARIRPATAIPPRYRRSAPHRRRHRAALTDNRPRHRPDNRSDAEMPPVPARPGFSPAPDRAFPGPPPCRSRPSTARRKSRSRSFRPSSSDLTRRTVS